MKSFCLETVCRWMGFVHVCTVVVAVCVYCVYVGCCVRLIREGIVQIHRYQWARARASLAWIYLRFFLFYLPLNQIFVRVKWKPIL